MAKNWETVYNNNIGSSAGTISFDKVRKTTKMSEEALKKEGKALAAKTEAENASLIQAYTEKRLKSKTLIKKARALIKAQQKQTTKVVATVDEG